MNKIIIRSIASDINNLGNMSHEDMLRLADHLDGGGEYFILQLSNIVTDRLSQRVQETMGRLGKELIK